MKLLVENNNMNENVIEGKIAAILDKTTVVINRGGEQGVKRGTEFYIYTKLGPFFDPDTNESLGETTKIWGRVETTIVEEKFCIARTHYDTNAFSRMLIPSLFRTTRFELPVDENDITRLMEKVKIGFPVISIPDDKELEEKNKPELLEEVRDEPKMLPEEVNEKSDEGAS